MSDSDYEESVVAVVELKGIMNSDILFQEKPAKILAPESENPVLQFGDYIFRGEWQQTMGTVVGFEKPDDKDSTDQKCKFVAKADRKLSLQRIFLEEKKECKNSNETESSKKVLNGSDADIKGKDLCNGHNHKASNINGNTEEYRDVDKNRNDTISGDKSSHLTAKGHSSLESTSRRSVIDSEASGSGSSYGCSSSASGSGLIKESRSGNRKSAERIICGKRIHPKEFDSVSQSLSQVGNNNVPICEEIFNLQETAGRVLSDVLSRIESTSEMSNVVDSVAGFYSPSGNSPNSLIADTSDVRGLSVASSSSALHVRASARDNELTNESEDRSVGSSEADFIVLSEYCNEASCDTEGDIPVELTEPADSSDEVCSTRKKMESLSTDCVESSGSEAGIANSDVVEGNLVTVIVDSLLSEVQSMQCIERASSMSPVVHEDDVADSASSVEESKCTQRNSESFYPLVCDSASGEGTSHSRVHEPEDMEISTADCSDTFQISTSARISSSQCFANVFEDEAMDTTENITGRTSVGNEVDSVEVMEVIATENEQNSDRNLIFPKPHCSHKSDVVNSTVGATSNASVKVILLQEEEVSGSSEEDDLCVSHSSSATFKNFKAKDSGLIDSTSNKVCSMNTSHGNNLKPIPGIDSTTNDSGKKRCKGKSLKRDSTNLTNTVNEKIDSTMNRVAASAPPEDVDFEMREATNVAVVEDDDVCKNSNVEESEPIDSTSSIIQHTKNFCNVSNVSESSAIISGESSQQSYQGSRVSYSPCNVTESHIDDGKPLSSFVVSSPGSENLQSDLAESSERSSEIIQDITESNSYDPHNYDVTESSLQDDSYGASSSQVVGSCGSSSFKNYRSDLDIDNEEDSVNKVTESINSPSSMNLKVSISAHEVTDSTNISHSSSHLNSKELSESPLVIIGDSSVCEVTESSSVISEELIVVDAEDSVQNNSRHTYSQHCTESPSSGDVASGSDVTESRRFTNESFFNTDNNSSSGDGKEPSSSGLNTSEIHVSEACSSAGVVSTENEMYYYSSAGSQDIATNEVSMSSSSMYWSSPSLVQASDYEISNSLEQNADSTEGEHQSSPSNRNNEHSTTGGDSSKLPSSTSN